MRIICKRYIQILLIAFFCINVISCQTTPINCELATHQASALITMNRGPIDGGFDENKDGKISSDEAFTSWDFFQITRVLHSGLEDQAYKWTNIDTCYRFEMKAGDFYEDKSQKAIWQTCRDITIDVYSPEKQFIGTEKTKGCRNFATHEWDIL